MVFYDSRPDLSPKATLPTVVYACYEKGVTRARTSAGGITNTNKSKFTQNYSTKILNSGSIVSTFKHASTASTLDNYGVYQNNPGYSGTFIIENVHRSKEEEGQYKSESLSLSEIVYFQIGECESEEWSWSKILQISMIANNETREVVKHIKKDPLKLAKVEGTMGKGIRFSYPDVNFCALLGSPLGTTAWGLVKDHGTDLGITGVDSVFCAFVGKLYFFFKTK